MIVVSRTVSDEGSVNLHGRPDMRDATVPRMTFSHDTHPRMTLSHDTHPRRRLARNKMFAHRHFRASYYYADT